MANVIHALKTLEDKLLFRVWSTEDESYISEEMEEYEFRKWYLENVICEATEDYLNAHNNHIHEHILVKLIRKAIKDHLKTIDQRIKNASGCGSDFFSGNFRDRHELTRYWEEERE